MAARVGKYLLFETIGQGAYGKVKLGVHEDTGEQVAVKILDKNDIQAMDMTVNVRREIAIMKALKHKNIVNLIQVLTSSNKLYLVMELVTGGELFQKILDEGKLEENLARRYFQEIVCGIEYCHRRGVYHRDLKPENLLIDEASGSIKITDFGLSAMKKDDDYLLHTQVGSPNYCAPEVIARAKAGYEGAKVDAWSCGIILFALCTGYLPFFDENTKNLFKLILKTEVKYPKSFPPGARDICTKLLMKSPDERASLAEIKKHPWFLMDFVSEEEEIVTKRKFTQKRQSMPQIALEQTGEGSDQQLSSRSGSPHPVEKSSSSNSAAKVTRASTAEEIRVKNPILENPSYDHIEAPSQASTPQVTSPPNAGTPGVASPHHSSVTPLSPRSAHLLSQNQKPLEEMGIRERIDYDITRYRAIFQLGQRQSLIASKSFKGELKRKQKTHDAKDVTLRAKSITGAWAVNLAQQLLVCDEDSEFTVSIEELAAFEELLDVWEQRAKEVENKDQWWDVCRPIDQKETSHILILLKILEPKPIDAEISELEVESTSNSENNNSFISSAEENDRSNSNMTDSDDLKSLGTTKIRWPTMKRATEPTSGSRRPSETDLDDEAKKRDGKVAFGGLGNLGGRLFNILPGESRFTASGNMQFETKLPAQKAIKVIGLNLMDQGAQVMMKRGENKLKCEKTFNGVGLVVSIVADELQNKTVISMKKSRGAKLEKEFLEMYQAVMEKFEE